MMASLTFSVFLKLYHAALTIGALCSSVQMAKVIEANKGISRGSSSLGVGYAKFKKDKFYYLNITSLGSRLVETESLCGLACLETSPCFSYNMAAFPDINGQRFCELLPSDKFNNSEMLVPSNSHHHYFIASQCSSWPCKNKGKCVSLYEENSYVCVCEDGFTGKNCETNVNECESNPCLNNGTCVHKINGFNCSCPPGIGGNRCEKGCPEVWTPYNASCYKMTNTRSSHADDARKKCKDMEADLPVIYSKEENDFIVKTFNLPVWLGLLRSADDSKFYWVDGTPVQGNYVRWASGEPNNFRSNENCAKIGNKGDWLDSPCQGGHLNPYVLCQIRVRFGQ